ncbi:movement protein [Blueberry green mosaic associated virus]|uniref:Movement protein n=1 Tax=Blueberry green mosaic associated virus TaxID=2605718 RepID=A0AAE6IQE6_9VIRU|nr:movement protein [Blueberry green mosaic associated virus]QEH60475.1 movement protein [Blueberry green mosaic associated virus]
MEREMDAESPLVRRKSGVQGPTSGRSTSGGGLEDLPRPKEVRVFDVKKKNVENFSDLRNALGKGKVYDIGIIDRMFPSHTHKLGVTKELVAGEGEMVSELDLIDADMLENMDQEKYPLLHIGCLCVGVLPLGQNLPGTGTVELIDGRRGKEGVSLMRFGFELKGGLAAFCSFPNFCIAASDLVDGYRLTMKLTLKGIDFKEGTHPISTNLLSICREIDESVETKVLLKEANRQMYQPLLNSYYLDPMKYAVKLKTVSELDGNDEEVMSAVRETIRKLEYGSGQKESGGNLISGYGTQG